MSEFGMHKAMQSKPDLLTLQVINDPRWITVTWEDGVVNCLNHAIVRN